MNIYKITNLINGKVYIGQTKNTPQYRFDQHYREAKSHHKKNYGVFHDALLKYGKNNFTVELIETVEDQRHADERERFWIQQYHSDNILYGYNYDSGGIANNTKNDITKRKIGDTTYEKWADPNIAARMKEGLAKGTATVKANIIRVPFKCPVCGKTLFLEPWESKRRKVCSQQCSVKAGNWIKGVESSAVINHNNNIERKALIKQDIIKWCINNKDIVNNCPKNAISNQLSGLKQMLIQKHNIKDWRTIYICFNVSNLKSLLNVLQEITLSHENIC